MMRDANAHHSNDPAERWSAQLEGIHGRRREAIIRALRDSDDSGYPANAESVRILVSYAQGQISARQYVAQIMESLGFIPSAYAPPARQPESWRQPEPWREPTPRPDRWAHDRPAPAAGLLDFNESRMAREPQRSTTITQSRRTTRQEAVQAYVKGQIPMEEFLRLSRAQGK